MGTPKTIFQLDGYTQTGSYVAYIEVQNSVSTSTAKLQLNADQLKKEMGIERDYEHSAATGVKVHIHTVAYSNRTFVTVVAEIAASVDALTISNGVPDGLAPPTNYVAEDVIAATAQRYLRVAANRDVFILNQTSQAIVLSVSYFV